MKSRAEEFGQYIMDNNTTIRKTAEHFDISKSTVHNDISKKLRYENLAMYVKVKKILEHNFNVKHLRGGDATKLKYKKIENIM